MKLPFRRLAQEFARSQKDGSWLRLGALIDRNFEEIVRAANVAVLDVTNVLSGSTPTSPFLVQGGTNVDVDASPFTITYDTPFPNGVVSVVACFGDSPGVSDSYVTGVTTTEFVFSSSAAVGHRVNWIALGW